MICWAPTVVLHPAVAIESAPVSAGITASAALLPPKEVGSAPVVEPVVAAPEPLSWRAPWQKGWEVLPAVLELPDPLSHLATSPSPFLKVLAGEESDDAVGPADSDLASPVVEEDLSEEAPANSEVGIDPPEESDDAWTPADPVDPVDPDVADPGAGGGEPRDLLPIEREQGNCVITGEVSDVTTLEPIAGASVVVLGQGREDITDAQGRFRIGGLPTGDYTVEAVKLEYSIASVAASPRPGAPAEVRLALRKKPAVDTADGEYMLAEESVVGEYNETNQGDFNLELTISQGLSSGLDKEELSRTGVSDAAGAVSKISGANIVGGRYAVVRGLGDRYSNTLFNGSQISSADPSRKAVQLDLFPSHLLQAVNIYKTYTPNVTGEWAGGLVALETLAFPEERILEVEIGTKYKSNLEDARDFFVIPESDPGFLGLGNGPGMLTNDFGLKSRTLGSNAERKAFYESLNTSRSVRPARDSAKTPLGIDITYGETFELRDGIELGVVAAFTQGQEDDVVLDRFQGRGYDPTANRLNQKQTVNEYERKVDWGLLLAAGLRVGDHHELGLNYFRYHDATDSVKQMRFGEGSGGPAFVSSNPRQPDSATFYGDAAFIYDAYDQLDPLRRDLEVTQLRGSHAFGEDPDRGIKLNWNLARSEASEIRPHTSQYNFDQLDFADPRLANLTYPGVRVINLPGGIVIEIPDPSVQIPESYDPSRGQQLTTADTGQEGIAGTIINLTRESLSTEEQMMNGNLDLAIPYYFSESSDDRFELGFGGSFLEREREVRGELFYLLGRNEVVNFPLLIDRDDGQFGIDATDSLGYGTEYQDGSDIFDGRVDGPNSLYYRRATISRDTRRNVDAATTIDAAYLTGTLNLNRWELMIGGRFESETRSYEILGPGTLNFVAANEAIRGEQTNQYFLPAVRLRRAFGDEDRFRVETAWSRTVGRPTFYEFAPIQTEDQGTGDVRLGNPDLTDSLIENFDLSFRYAPTDGTVFGLSLFHKLVDQPIIKAFELAQSDLGADVLTYRNGDEGVIQGVEFEVSKNLLTNWNVTANYTYINSNLETNILAPGGGTQPVTIGFEGQPEQIVNFILGYDNDELGLGVNLIYNYTGEYLGIVPRAVTDDRVMQEARSTLDLVIKKELELFGCDGTLTFKAGNLLDAEVRSFYDPSGFDYDRYSPGRTFALSYETSF